MNEQPNLIISSNHVAFNDRIAEGAFYVQNGRIVQIASTPQNHWTGSLIDAEDNYVLPGVVDTHVHINEPGRTEWEGFETATKAAAAGGITTLVDMPLNSIPVTTTHAALMEKMAVADGSCYVDYGFWGGVVPGNALEIEPMIDAGVLGFKCFLCHSGIDDFPLSSESDLRVVMPILARRGIPLLVHAELCPAESETTLSSSTAYLDYLSSRPRSFENDAIELMIRLARETACHVHIVHLSSSDALDAIAAAKRDRVPITVETCPHYLFFAAEDIPDGATHFKCAPPIRELSNREKLWQGLVDRVIDFVVCDHSPCTPQLKLRNSGDFLNAWGGISSLQFSPSIVLTEVIKRGISPQTWIDWICRRPALFSGLGRQKGHIAVGYDADFAFWDVDATYELAERQIFHRHRLTPYLGQRLQGVVNQTWLRGHKIWHVDGHEGNAQGTFLRGISTV